MSANTAAPAALIEWLQQFPTEHPAAPLAATWRDTLTAALAAGARGTMRAWFERHNGRTVDTLQATVADTGNVSGVWTPTGRTISATRAGSVQLDGSTRDYAGCRVIAARDNALVIVTPWGDNAAQVCAYTLTA